MSNPNTAVATVSKQDREMEYIPFGSDQAIKLSIAIVQNMICIPTKSGKICSEKEAMKFMMLCKARALNPYEGDAFLQGYDGRDGAQFSLITAHQAFLKRAEIHPEFDGMRSGIILSESVECVACKGAGQLKSGKPCKRCNEMGVTDEIVGDLAPEKTKVIGGWATVFFKNRREPMHKRLSMAVFNKGFGRWDVDACGMIVKCAEADALRSSFPTKLGGLFLREEQESVTPKVETSRGIFGAAGMGTEIERAAITETASTPEPEPSPEPEPTRATRPAKAAKQPISAGPSSGGPSPAASGEERPAPPAQTQAAPAPAAKTASPLETDKTRFSAWALDRGFTWSQMKEYVRQEYGAWVEHINDFSDLSLQQAKTLFQARGEIENAIIGSSAQ